MSTSLLFKFSILRNISSSPNDFELRDFTVHKIAARTVIIRTNVHGQTREVQTASKQYARIHTTTAIFFFFFFFFFFCFLLFFFFFFFFFFEKVIQMSDCRSGLDYSGRTEIKCAGVLHLPRWCRQNSHVTCSKIRWRSTAYTVLRYFSVFPHRF